MRRRHPRATAASRTPPPADMAGARWAMPLDAFFLMSESEQTQMHVAALMPFHLPAEAPDPTPEPETAETAETATPDAAT